MCFAALAGFALGGLNWVLPVSFSLVTGVLMAVTVVAAPGLRWGLLKLSIVAAMVGGVIAVAGAGVEILVPLLLTAIVLLVLRLRWLDRFHVPWTQKAMAHVEISRSVDTVWRIVRPVPGASYWDPSVEAIMLDTEPDGLLLKRRMPDGRLFDHRLQLLEVAPLRFLKLRDRSYPDVMSGGPVTITAFSFSGDHEMCRLLVIEAEWNRPLWKSISLWLDDYLGDYADHMAALIERRADPSLRGLFLRALDRR